MTNIEKILDAMDQIVLPASTADIYNRMVRVGYTPALNAARERADVSSALARMRKKGLVTSAHDDAGVLLWDVEQISKKPLLRLTNETKVAIKDEIQRVRKELPVQIVLAELFDEVAQSLTHAANVLRKIK
jgi:hypothetical protein